MAARRKSAPKFSAGKSYAISKRVEATNRKGGGAKAAQRSHQARVRAQGQRRDSRGRFA